MSDALNTASDQRDALLEVLRANEGLTELVQRAGGITPDMVETEAFRGAERAGRRCRELGIDTDRWCLRDAQPPQPAAARATIARPISEWHEEIGDCLWWRFPIDEPPYVGSQLDDDWPGYHTHFTRIECPSEPAATGGAS